MNPDTPPTDAQPMNDLPTCYRCHSTPCKCRDRVTLYEAEAEDVLPLIPHRSVDLVLTDPPYSSGGLHRSDRNQKTAAKYRHTNVLKYNPDFAGDSRDQRALALWFSHWMRLALHTTRPGGVLACFIDWRNIAAAVDAVQVAGWTYRGLLVWDKTEAARPSMAWFRSQSEFLVLGSRGPIGRHQSEAAGRCSPGVLRHYLAPGQKHHLTAKPVALLEDVITTRDEWQTILDPFAGSGTTGLAAKKLARRAILAEHDPNYLATATRLLAQDAQQYLPLGPNP